MIAYIENLKELTKNLQEVISDYSKVAGHKSRLIYKSQYPSYISTMNNSNEIKGAMSFTLAPRK